MLDLSRERLRGFESRVSFVQADFKDDAWPSQVSGSFHAVVSMQAIHELRHKRHAPRLYARVRPLLDENGVALICDHLPGVLPHSDRLYMTESEQLEALASGGFREGRVIQTMSNMALYRAFA